MPANPYEERARAVKAAKLARVANRVIGELALAPAEETKARGLLLAHVDSDFRVRVARLAGTTPPSDQTWEIVCALVEAEAS